MVKLPIGTFLLVSGLYACSPAPSGTEKLNTVADSVPAAQQLRSREDSLIQQSTRILSLLKEGAYAELGAYIDPEYGIRFSPYAFVDTANDIHWSKAGFGEKIKENPLIEWGSYDGSGEPILLHVEDYFQKFIYPVDYLQADSVAVNRSIGQGNTINNIREIYPHADFVEYYIKGSDARFEGMDWSSLILIFRREGSGLYLSGIVHHQWTI